MEVSGWGQLKVQNSRRRNKMVEEEQKKNKKKEIEEENKIVETSKKEPEKKEEEKGKPEEKKKEKKKEKQKKNEVVVNSYNLPISTKQSVAICKFIKNKRIGSAIGDLEEVISQKKAVPMKGEIPHRKGKKMMSGRFPKKAAEHFIKMLKTLSSNASVNEIENPIIIEAIANIGSRPYGRFGRIRRKRTHVKIKAKEKKEKKK